MTRLLNTKGNGDGTMILALIILVAFGKGADERRERLRDARVASVTTTTTVRPTVEGNWACDLPRACVWCRAVCSL